MARRDLIAVGVIALTLAAVVAIAQKKAVSGDWPMYNYDLAGTRHSPLTQINTRNVSALAQAWSYKLGRDRTAGTIARGSEFTPIAVGGVLYLAASDRVVALEPDTGRETWRYTLKKGAPSRRGVTYWRGDATAPPRIFVTSERRLIALNAATGKPATAFGKDGQVDMAAPYNSAPTLYKNLLIVGTDGPPGGVRAFDVRTGAKVWDFRRPNTYGLASSQTLDQTRGILYVAVDGNSLLALDAATGTLKWHFQTVRHDLRDYDLPSPPSLLDVTIGGQVVPVLAQTSKTGYLYILNRMTGTPVFGIEERAASDTTAEHAAYCRALLERSGGTAADPELGYVFVNTNDEANIGWAERSSDSGLCQPPPVGTLAAVNVKTGDIAWKVPLGVTNELPEGRKNTGRLNPGGPMNTAGGLVFIGATNDRFRAFDARSGKELWTTRLAMSAHAVPMTFQGRNGRQYVAVTASGAGALDDPMPEGSEALVVFALP